MIFNRFVLDNVLFVPTLTCNLLSVSQLFDKLCIIQEHTLRNLIGAEVQCNGVYFFRHVDSSRANNVTVTNTSMLWHRRFGHPSMKVLSCLPANNGLNKICNTDCQICYIAK